MNNNPGYKYIQYPKANNLLHNNLHEEVEKLNNIPNHQMT